MTIIEGYAAGVPVIGAKIGGIPEIIEDGRTGYLFESGNKGELIGLIKKSDKMDKEEYMVMCDHTLVFAKEHFDRNKYYPRLTEFFKKFIN